ncbi:MAG: MarR family winged helix-turn-helix transcriptional regulator [Pseudorhodoplanes sp.]|nr:MAG: winged helix-turn-helix transcriptional regulator [Pseudorhodoplanes sp.]MBZ0140943.1 MarR family winged helix-turn-helix transcriptional regulator [Pseudorhodoplanes sp.]
MKRARAHPSPTERKAPSSKDAGRLSLQAFIPYRLNSLAQVVSDGFAVAYSEIFGISPPEWRVLATLGEFSQMSAKEISQHSRMHKTRVSRAVLSLEKRRLLIRAPSAVDRREEILSLSQTGHDIYDAVAPMAIQYQDRLLTGLSEADQASLDRLIRHLMERASAPWRPAPIPDRRKR